MSISTHGTPWSGPRSIVIHIPRNDPSRAIPIPIRLVLNGKLGIVSGRIIVLRFVGHGGYATHGLLVHGCTEVKVSVSPIFSTMWLR